MPGAIPVPVARDGVHFLGRVARRGGHLSRVHPLVGRVARRHFVFRRRLCCSLVVAAGAGLDSGTSRPQARHLICARRSVAKAC